jgi:hypothetical protein
MGQPLAAEEDEREPGWQPRLLAWGAPVLAAALSGAAGAFKWRGVDWPAQLYRTQFFRSHGWVAFDTGWYGGQYPLAYSVLFPVLAGIVGLSLLSIVCSGTATWAFDRLVRQQFGPRAWMGSVCFAVGTGIEVAIGQLPFLLGTVFGLLAVIALRSGRPKTALLAAVACPLASPVAAAFTGLAAVAWAVTGTGRVAWRLTVAAGALAPVGLFALLYPQGGRFPFTTADLVFVLLLCGLAIAILPGNQPALRLGAAMYAAAAVGLFLIPTPLGGNMTRLALTIGLPVVVAGVATRPRPLLSVAAVPLLLWQWTPAFGSIAADQRDPSRNASYFSSLLTELARRQAGPSRMEIPVTRDHWEAAWVAPSMALARGWYRQLDTKDNDIFYRSQALTVADLHAWLLDNGVTWIALPDVPLDWSSLTEAAVLATGPDFLRPVWHDAHWQLWQVVGSPGLVTGPATLTSMVANSFAVRFDQPGAAVIRVRYTPHWSVDAGRACVSPTVDGWTAVKVTAPGPVDVSAKLLPADHDRC